MSTLLTPVYHLGSLLTQDEPEMKSTYEFLPSSRPVSSFHKEVVFVLNTTFSLESFRGRSCKDSSRSPEICMKLLVNYTTLKRQDGVPVAYVNISNT